jgi:hypothetical protein
MHLLGRVQRWLTLDTTRGQGALFGRYRPSQLLVPCRNSNLSLARLPTCNRPSPPPAEGRRSTGAHWYFHRLPLPLCGWFVIRPVGGRVNPGRTVQRAGLETLMEPRSHRPLHYWGHGILSAYCCTMHTSKFWRSNGPESYVPVVANARGNQTRHACTPLQKVNKTTAPMKKRGHIGERQYGSREPWSSLIFFLLKSLNLKI